MENSCSNEYLYVQKQLVVKRANYNLAADVKQTLYFDTYCNYSKYYCVFVSQFGNIKYLAIPFPLYSKHVLEEY